MIMANFALGFITAVVVFLITIAICEATKNW